MKIILGLIIMAAGIGITIQTEWILENFGSWRWFEDKLGAEGGSRLGYKLLGLIAIFIGLLMATGLINGFVLWVLSPLIRNQSQ